MDYFFDLAFALSNKSLCFFTGAGFSKQLTANKMPSWKKLLERSCMYLKDHKTAGRILDESLKESLPLEDCARILELRFFKEKKDFREAISEEVRSYKIDKDSSETISSFLNNHKTVKIITPTMTIWFNNSCPPSNAIRIILANPLPIETGCSRCTISMAAFCIRQG